MRRVGLACALGSGLAACSFAPAAQPDAPATNAISVTRNLVTLGTTIDLTSEGTLDWAEWGATSGSDFDHKATGGGLIASWTEVGAGPVTGYGDDYHELGIDGFTWSDGTPTSSQQTAQFSGVWVAGAANGFSTTVPAEPASHVLRLYVGGYHATGTFTASLSTDASLTYTDADGLGDAGDSWAGVYAVTYESASAGATLTVSWVQDGSGSDVNWSAASLQ